MKTNTRENIKGCFLELLEESPFSHITVKDIVERCAINRNTFYYYFQDMAALAEAVQAQVGDTLSNDTQKTANGNICYSLFFYVIPNR
jgi:AcrR family transcriptional regulator